MNLNSLRLKRVILGSSVTIGSKAVGTFCQLITTAFVAMAFSSEAFGIWTLLLSGVILSACFDFGLGGPVLRNLLTESRLKLDGQAKQFFFASFHVLFVLYFCLALLFLIFSAFFPFDTFFHLQEKELVESIHKIFGLTCFFLCLRIPFALNIDAFYGCHETHIRGILDGIEACVLSLVAILSVKFKGSFAQLVYHYFATYALLSFLSFLFFLKRRKWQFTWLFFHKALQLTIPYRKASVQFWLQNVLSFFLFYQIPFFIAHFIGPSQAGEFSLMFKLFSVLIGVHFAFMTPLWGNYKEAFLLKDWGWICQVLKKSIFLTSLAFCCLIPIAVFLHPFIIKIWVHKVAYIPLIVCMTGMITFLYALMSCYLTLLNAMAISHIQMVCFVCFSILLFLFAHFSAIWGTIGILGLYIILLIAVVAIFASYTRSTLLRKSTT